MIRLIGRRRVLAILLQGSRVVSRLAWETAGEYFGERYFTALYALSPDVLRRWIPDGARIVDIGCGKGRVSRLVADRAELVIGVDHNRDHIAAAGRTRNPPNVVFKVGDVRNVADRFDVAIVSHVLGCLEEPEALLVAVHDIAPLLIVEVADIGADALNLARISVGVDFSTDAGNVREYDKNALIESLRRTNWRVTAWAYGPGSLAALAAPDLNESHDQ
jgi:SAM-dependent methyltransferase